MGVPEPAPELPPAAKARTSDQRAPGPGLCSGYAICAACGPLGFDDMDEDIPSESAQGALQCAEPAKKQAPGSRASSVRQIATVLRAQLS